MTNVNGIVQFQTTAGNTMSVGQVFPTTVSSVNLNSINTAGTYTAVVSTGGVVPIVWAANSIVSFTVIYQTA
jgi:hypothetical protein